MHDFAGSAEKISTNTPIAPPRSGLPRRSLPWALLGAAALPAVPTVAEQGFADYEVVTWQGILAPAGTPAPVVARLNALLLDALRRPDLDAGLVAQGFETRGGTPDDFAGLIRAEAARGPGIVRLAQATLD